MSFFTELKRRNVLRVATAYVFSAWLVVQVADTLFPLFQFDSTPARIVVIVLAIGFVPALILAWAFEWTADGLKLEHQVDRSQSIAPQTAKRLDRFIIVVLTLALGYFMLDKFLLLPRHEAAQERAAAEKLASATERARLQGRAEALVESYGNKSIAVLAFQDMSQNKDQEYLSDGIAEELLNLLTRIPELRVISRSSAFSYKGKDVNLRQVAEELNVSYILEGSIRQSGNLLRITARLIDAHSDSRLWSQTYESTPDDIFAIQDAIANIVVERMKLTLRETLPAATETSTEAFGLYLQARHLSRQITATALEQSTELFEQVLAIDPNFAPAWNGLARNYNNQASKGLRTFEDGFGLARAAAQKALSINPDFALAHARLGWIAIVHDHDLRAAASHLSTALSLAPADLDILSNAAVLLQNLGRLEQALALGEFIVAHDPLVPVGHANLGLGYLYAGYADKAISAYRTALRLSAGYIGAHYHIGRALLAKGEPEAALAEFSKEKFEVYRLIGQVLAQHALARAQEADATLAELIEKYQKEWSYEIAYVQAYRQRPDLAFEWLEKARTNGDPGISYAPIEPLFRNIHADVRWLPFLSRLGSAPEQLNAIDFQVVLPGTGSR